ncbi:MAG: efflux transporter outer membrane subunit [Simplicispira sp.]|nr:efflux transporter outer membrane subunit [Simplicispira sp.]
MNLRHPFHRRRTRTVLAWASSALLLTACALPVAPPAEPRALAVPDHWSTTGGQALAPAVLPEAPGPWWEQFGDAQLSALITQALAAHTSVRSAREALAQARAQVDVQAASLAPQLGTSAQAQRGRAANNTSNSFRLGLDASWELDLFGGGRAGVDAAQADVEATAAALGSAQVSLAAEVAVNYIALRGLQERLAIARSNLSTQRETLQISDWRLQAGLTSSLVTEQARAAVEQTAAQVPTLESSLAQTRHALAVLAGQPPAALDAALADAAPVPQAPADLALAIPAQTLRQRADVRTAEARIRAALARVSQADAARYPSLRISGNLGLSAATLGALTGGASVASALLAGISVPLFDGGAARAQVRVQESALEQARIGYEATVLAALQDVEDALVALQGDRERLARLQAAAGAAANADLLARQRYQSGLIDFPTVLDTQRTLLSAQDGVASAQASLATDHVRLYKALGGGWVPGADGTAKP